MYKKGHSCLIWLTIDTGIIFVRNKLFIKNSIRLSSLSVFRFDIYYVLYYALYIPVTMISTCIVQFGNSLQINHLEVTMSIIRFQGKAQGDKIQQAISGRKVIWNRKTFTLSNKGRHVWVLYPTLTFELRLVRPLTIYYCHLKSSF